MAEQEDQEYYVYPVLPGTDYRIHTNDHPFCDELGCPCHEDEENQATLQNWYDSELVGSVDGDLIYRGRTI